jgi:anti-anti-sigma factor
MSDPFGSLLTIEVRPDPECTYVCPAGELDMAVCGRIEREVGDLLDAGCPAVVLDLRELTFVDSSGVRELLRCREAARDSGARLELVLAPGAVTRALEVYEIRDLFEVRAA